MILYTAGYRDPETDRRLDPADFYASLPPDAVVCDIRSVPYSPFAPGYTGDNGVARAVARHKPGRTESLPIRALGNTHRDASGKRRSPPVYVDAGAGFDRLHDLLLTYRLVVIFCACSKATLHSPDHRCHRFFVADEMARRLPGLTVVHLP